MKKFSHIFFDLDRTLWDFESNANEVLSEIYNDFSLKLYFKNYKNFSETYHSINKVLWEKYRYGTITKDMLRWKRFADTLKLFDCNDTNVAKEIGEVYIEKSSKKTILFPNAIETLAELKNRNYLLYVLTNGFKEVQHFKVINCNLAQYIERVFTSEEAGRMKPSAVFYNYVLERLDVKSENCLMIGDDEVADILGAKNCNIKQVLFNPSKFKSTSEPTYEISNLKELLNVL